MTDPYFEILCEALAEPVGLEVESSNPVLLKQRFYALRRKHDEFSCLSFITHPTNPDGAIWIVKNE